MASHPDAGPDPYSCPDCIYERRKWPNKAEWACDKCERVGQPAPLLCGFHADNHTDSCEIVAGWCDQCDRYKDDHPDEEVCDDPPNDAEIDRAIRMRVGE